MSAIAERRATTARPSARSRKRTARAPLGGSLVWVVVLGALLAGVVAINVLVLQLNVELDRLGRERAQLKADIATTRAQLSTASANARIESRAAAQLGLVPADPALTTYVRLEPSAR
jgi:cell division protein FtsL